MTIQYYGPTPAVGPVSAVVMADLPCVQCGVNLRGLQFDQRCPACGTPVGRSVEGDLFRYTEPELVAIIQRGLKWMLVALLTPVGIGIVGGVVGAVIGMVNAASSPGSDPAAMQRRMADSIFVSSILAHAGYVFVVLIAAQGIRIITSSSLLVGTLRRINVSPAVVSLLWAIGVFTATILHAAGGAQATYRPSALQSVTGFVNCVLQAILLLSLLPYVREISRRAGAGEVGKLLRISMVGLAISSLVAAAMNVVIARVGPSPEEQIRNPFGNPLLTCSAALPGLAVMLAMILLIVSLFQMFGRVRAAYRQASQIFARSYLPPPIPAVAAPRPAIDVNGLDRPA